MDNKKTITALAAQVEDLTEMLNRVRSVIRSAGVDRTKQLDPKGLLQMTTEEYSEHLAEMQRISDEHDARRKALAAMHPDAIQAQIDELESAQLSSALSGLAS